MEPFSSSVSSLVPIPRLRDEGSSSSLVPIPRLRDEGFHCQLPTGWARPAALLYHYTAFRAACVRYGRYWALLSGVFRGKSVGIHRFRRLRR